MDNPSHIMTEVEVAALLSVTPDALRRARRAGIGPPPLWLSPRKVRYRRDAVEAWIASRPQAHRLDAAGASRAASPPASTLRESLPEILTEAEAARLFHVDQRHMRRLREAGQVPFLRVGARVIRYRRDALLAHLDQAPSVGTRPVFDGDAWIHENVESVEEIAEGADAAQAQREADLLVIERVERGELVVPLEELAAIRARLAEAGVE